MTKIIYPLAKATVSNEDIDALCDWLKTYPRLTKGDLTIEFEEKLAKWVGMKYSVFVNSGSSANMLMIYALLVSGRLRNKKIVVPSVGWVTTISPVMQFGLEPIMLGADPNTYGIDLDAFEKVCKEQQPAACIFVQVLGIPHYKRIKEIADKYGVLLLEDACAAQGSMYADGTKVGALGLMSSFSYYAGHHRSTIEGGSIHTNDYDLYNTLIMLRSHGWGKDLAQEEYDRLVNKHGIDSFHKPFTFFLPGFNVRATDLQAFIGLRQLDNIDELSKRRNENHLAYAENLKGIVEYQNWGNDFPVSISFGCLAASKEERTRIVTKLVENGIETRIFSAGNLGKSPFWKDTYGEFNDPMANKIHDRGFFLPNYPELTLEEVGKISDIVSHVHMPYSHSY